MNFQKIEASTLVLFLIATGVGIVGWASPAQFHPNIPLGQWNSFPTASQCSAGNFSATVCELMGNTSYRGEVIAGSGTSVPKIGVELTVTCLVPSNTPGARLQLQYANATILAGQYNGQNTTNFVSVASQNILIDNSVNAPCPGVLHGSNSGFISLPFFTPAAFMFRVVGTGGGGPGDNPRFSSIAVGISSTIIANNLMAVRITAHGTTSFTAIAQLINGVPSTAEALSFEWIATNASSTNPGCGTNPGGGTDVCWQHGTATCTTLVGIQNCSVTTTYTTAFTGTVDVVCTDTSAFPIGPFAVGGQINLLSAQTLTV